MREVLLSIVLLVGTTASWCLAEPQAAATSGTIAVVEWVKPDSGLLEPLGTSCPLLAYSADLAVVLLPAGFTIPAGLDGRLKPLESLETTGGNYYLYHVADAGLAAFAGPTRVLLRRGHTVLLWSAEGAPRLTAASETLLRGIKQPLLISLVPKAPPPRPCSTLKALEAPVEFDPLVAGMVAAVDQAEYTRVWQALDDFETRYTFTPQNQAAAAWIAEVFASYGLEVETHVYVTSPKAASNTIGILRGLLEPARTVYIVAHFDSTSNQPTTHAPGADDNASGVAAVMEAARVLSQHPFRYTIKFAAFNGEEMGMVGSGAYCDMMKAAQEDIIGSFNFDMIAYTGSDTPPPDLAIYTNSASLGMARVLAAACTTFVPDGVEPVIIEDGSVGWSDHVSFWNRGWQALTGIEAGAWDPSEFCPWYHTIEDQIEKYPKDYPTRVTAAAVAAVAQFANPIPPEDCNGNGILDLVELETGTGADCNKNGVPDDCDIAAGTALDRNRDGIPDECVPPIPFKRGDSNGDRATDVSDAIATLDYLFLGVNEVPCEQAGDANDDGVLDISDALFLLNVLFLSGQVLEPPVGTCGPDPTEHSLPCDSFPPSACP